jgi:hypothetical protein
MFNLDLNIELQHQPTEKQITQASKKKDGFAGDVTRGGGVRVQLLYSVI